MSKKSKTRAGQPQSKAASRYSVKGTGAKAVVHDGLSNVDTPIPDAAALRRFLATIDAPATAAAPAVSKGSKSKAKGSKTAVRPAKSRKAKKSKAAVARGVKSGAGKSGGTVAKTKAVQPSKAPAAAKTVKASKASKASKGSKTAVKRPAAKKSAKKSGKKAQLRAAAVPEKRRRRRPVPSRPQQAGEMPKFVSQYMETYSIETALMTRQFFETEKRWGYKVEIDGREAGALICDRAESWMLTPSATPWIAKRFAAVGAGPTLHKTPVSALMRVKNSWIGVVTGRTPDRVVAA